MNAKKCKALRKAVRENAPIELMETKYLVLRASSMTKRQFTLSDCWRGRYQKMKKNSKRLKDDKHK